MSQIKPGYTLRIISKLACTNCRNNNKQDQQTKKLQAVFPSVIAYWLGGSVVERQALTGELSLFCTRPAADG